MRLLVSWLRDFVDVTAPVEEIAERIGLRGFEVAAIEPAPDGVRPPWQTAAAAPDGVIDFEVTANRPDCLSVLGLAREVATAYDLPLRGPSADANAPIALAPQPVGDSTRLAVSLEDAELCPRYAAAVADVTVKPSPAWLAARLQAAGVRPISSVVDVTNYVLIELGHPMHAFDLARLAGAALRIRRAARGETITTLDGIERKLEPDMLVIADANRAQAVAGVMGGAASEVSAGTTTIALESACFKPASVRRTSKRLGLKTEASARFERGADINAPVVALERAIALLARIGAGRVAPPIVDRYPHHRDAAHLHLRRARLAQLLGATVADAEVERILRSLGLAVTANPDGWSVVAPTFRVDLQREADLIEEVGRHYGFDRLPATFPPVVAPAPAADPQIGRDRLVRRVLAAAGLSEALTFGFVEQKAAAPFAPPDQPPIPIANPLSAKFDTLRPSLLPGLIDAVAHNRRHGRGTVALYEIGARFTRAGESHGVAIAWTGAAAEHWSGGTREVDFFDVKGAVERLCGVLDVPVRFEPAAVPYLVEGRTASIAANGTTVGVVGQLAPALADARGLPRQDGVFVAELDLGALWRARVPRPETVRPLPRFPFVVRDLSIVVSNRLPAADIFGTILAAGAATAAPLVDVACFDRYQGKGVPEGSVSVSVRLTFQATDRTLTDAEVQHSFDTIVAALARDHGAVQR